MRCLSHLPLSVIALAALAALVQGCGSSAAPGRFVEAGFESERHGYAIPWAGRRGIDLGDAWEVESHVVRHRTGLPETPKRGAGFEGPLALDLDGDGEREHFLDGLYYDLRLRNREDGGVIWVRQVPLPRALESMPLGSIAERWAGDVERGRGLALPVDRAPSTPAARGVQVIDGAPLTVSGRDAYGLLVDAPDDGELSVGTREGRVRAAVVLVRSPVALEETSALGVRRFAAILIVGYASAPARFDPDLEELTRFLRMIKSSERFMIFS